MSTEFKLSEYCLVDHQEAARGGMPTPRRTPKAMLFKSMLSVDRKMHFTGLRGAAWRLLGVNRSIKNPNICNT